MVVSIFLISAAVLAYEILLMRLFAITQWHHFASMIISIALLGFGASGTFIALFRNRLKSHFLASYRLFAGLFPCAVLLSYFLSQQNAFNPFEIVWNPRQYLHLLEYYLTLFTPFFCAATCVGLAFTHHTNRIGVIYCANLLGSGVGVLGVIGGCYVVHPVQMVYIIVGVAIWGLIASYTQECFLVSRRDAETLRTPLITVRCVSASLRLCVKLKKHICNHLKILVLLSLFGLITAITVLGVKYDPLHLRGHLNISQYKGFSQARHFPNAEILSESVSPLGVVHAVSSPIIRNAPGLSLKYAGDVPAQIGLFVDSGNAGSILRVAPQEELEFLDFLTTSLVYHVRPASAVLILGAGGGMDVVNALAHQAAAVDAVELNPQIIDLVRHRFGDFSGHLYDLPNVRVFTQEARGYVEATPMMYDVIQLALLDAFGASAAGVYALNENYLYTIEALERYYSRLTPQGMLAITRWVKFPPRDDIKLFATAVEALANMGIAEPSRQLVSIRSWATCTVLLSKSPFTDDEVERVRQFCRERAFDANYFPGITEEEANMYNQLPSPESYYAAQALLFGSKEQFYRTYPYYIKPARDDSPYFFHFFTWKSLPALLKTMGKEWIPFIEWGYLVLLATLLQAAGISLVLILLPLFTLSRNADTPHRSGFTIRVYTFIYFTCLGLGYLFLEMACIQKFMLFLAHPIYAVAVVIASFLIFSGFGSLYFDTRTANRGTRNMPDSSLLFAAAGGILACSFGYLLVLPGLFASCSNWGMLAKLMISVGCIAPLGFCLGIPFPSGMHRLSFQAEPLLPWAYGINGCASVLSSLLATCLAIPYGFRMVILCAGLLYGIAAVTTRMFFESTDH